MYTRETSSRLRQEFWTTFGRYMNPVPSANGTKVNWINYQTGVRGVFFRMNADSDCASIAISLEHADIAQQTLYFEKILQLKTMLHTALQEEWVWKLHNVYDNRVSSRIYNTLPEVSIFNKDHWPDIISFLKPRIVALDSFWEDARYSFSDLD